MRKSKKKRKVNQKITRNKGQKEDQRKMMSIWEIRQRKILSRKGNRNMMLMQGIRENRQEEIDQLMKKRKHQLIKGRKDKNIKRMKYQAIKKRKGQHIKGSRSQDIKGRRNQDMKKRGKKRDKTTEKRKE